MLAPHRAEHHRLQDVRVGVANFHPDLSAGEHVLVTAGQLMDRAFEEFVVHQLKSLKHCSALGLSTLM
ncbi:hypothetical protein OMCYN_01756 [cyanobiont of Ornithocercus magnificus]|nr:hypothetical protein OMCYN_01756 [cyanobiont of Ornithocercus magnificus]